MRKSSLMLSKISLPLIVGIYVKTLYFTVTVVWKGSFSVWLIFYCYIYPSASGQDRQLWKEWKYIYYFQAVMVRVFFKYKQKQNDTSEVKNANWADSNTCSGLTVHNCKYTMLVQRQIWGIWPFYYYRQVLWQSCSERQHNKDSIRILEIKCYPFLIYIY